MAKGKLLEDTFEQLVELGQSTAKKTVKQVAKTLNPLDNPNSQPTENGKSPESNQKSPNHTPLDFDKLNNKFKDKDKLSTEALRNRLFQIVRQGDERMLMEKRQKEMEIKRREELENQEKRQKTEDGKRLHSEPIPMGKIRKSIFSSKKAAQQQHTEIRPATGKQ